MKLNHSIHTLVRSKAGPALSSDAQDGPVTESKVLGQGRAGLATGLTRRASLVLLTSLALTSCKVGPNHQPPDTEDITPAAWRWQTAAPRANEPRGEWWKVFRDPELNRLQSLAAGNNNTLRAAVARVDQARADARLPLTEAVPRIELNPSAERSQTSGNPPSPVPIRIPAARINQFSVPIDLSYELDLWGRVRRSFESARAQADAVEDDYHSVLLTLAGDVAAQYFQLRAFDSELSALNEAVVLRERSMDLLEQRLKAGTISEVDVARARSELSTARAGVADVKRERQEAQDTLSVLCGAPSSTFHVPVKPLTGSPPVIPAGVPASVLERRPDIASAERKVAAANAQIGIAKAAYFPTVRLTGQGGVLSNDADLLFNSASKVWSIGPSLNLPITGYAVIGFNVKKAKAAREEAIANYRQTVLTAVKDVDTSLAQIRFRREQAAAVSEALKSAEKAAELVRQQYDRGVVTYLDLLDAERSRLDIDRQSSQLTAQSYLATVRLIKAIGGAW